MGSKTKKGFEYIKLMKDKPERFLGEYIVSSGPIEARLRIIAHLHPHTMAGEAWVSLSYEAKISFEHKNPNEKQPKAKVTFDYDEINNLRDLFEDLSAREEDIEGILADLTMQKSGPHVNTLRIKPDWKFDKYVMRGILDLEEKVHEEKVIDRGRDFMAEYD